MTSSRLLTVPLLILMMQLAPARPFVVAHRGASGDAPENTLPAFRLAWEQGADAVEGDFHLTGDGHIVCIHDGDTEKVAGVKRIVRESTLEELKALDVGRWKDPRFAGTRIPTFQEVCAVIPADKKFFIEIKCGSEIVPVLLEAVAESALQDEQIVIISFKKEVVQAIRAERPRWTVNWLFGFDSKDAEAPQRQLPEILRTLEEVQASGLGSNHHPGLAPDHLARLAAAGFPHHVWTVNDEPTARRFLEMGSRSVTTDFPGRLRKALLAP